MVLCVIGACVLLLWHFSPSDQARGAGADNAAAAKAAAREAWEEQQKQALRTFHGQLDIYLDASEFKAGRPAFSDVRVAGLLLAGDTGFIHITNQANERWRINVEKIVAFRVRRK
jgi:hypothetical protein